MVRLGLVATWLVTAACGSGARDVVDAPVDSSVADAWQRPGPSHDAGPAPATSCGGDAGDTCALPPSTCLDSYYLLYYTDPVCDTGACRYSSNLMYCESGFCEAGGCVIVST